MLALLSGGQAWEAVSLYDNTNTKLLTYERDLPHVSHVYSFNPECILTCLLKLLRTLKGLLHVSHSYGFSPECILRW